MDFEAANAKIAPHGLLDLHKEAGGKKVLADRCIDIDVESLCNCILRRSSRDIDRESPDDRAPGSGHRHGDVRTCSEDIAANYYMFVSQDGVTARTRRESGIRARVSPSQRTGICTFATFDRVPMDRVDAGQLSLRAFANLLKASRRVPPDRYA